MIDSCASISWLQITSTDQDPEYFGFVFVEKEVKMVQEY